MNGRGNVQFLLLCAAALTAYFGIQQWKAKGREEAYVVGDNRRASLQEMTRLADSYDADRDPRVKALLADAEKSGSVDVDRLAAILRPMAQQAGKLSRPNAELRALASGQPEPLPMASWRTSRLRLRPCATASCGSSAPATAAIRGRPEAAMPRP